LRGRGKKKRSQRREKGKRKEVGNPQIVIRESTLWKKVLQMTGGGTNVEDKKKGKKVASAENRGECWGGGSTRVWGRVNISWVKGITVLATKKIWGQKDRPFLKGFLGGENTEN